MGSRSKPKIGAHRWALKHSGSKAGAFRQSNHPYQEYIVILELNDSHNKAVVEITSAGGRRRIHLGEKEIFFDWVRLADRHYSLILDGTVFDLLVNLGPDTCTVTSHEGTYSFRITDSRHSALRQHIDEGPAGVQRVCAEMPGKVIRVLVDEAETVAYDQSLLVLEAMKMQNEIRAPKSGVVKEIAVEGGVTVNTGEFLLSIES
jgi:biotin carboxyl carrier protein